MLLLFYMIYDCFSFSTCHGGVGGRGHVLRSGQPIRSDDGKQLTVNNNTQRRLFLQVVVCSGLLHVANKLLGDLLCAVRAAVCLWLVMQGKCPNLLLLLLL